jgi:hypothetical protein
MPNFQENYNQYNEPFPWRPESDRLPNQAPGSGRPPGPQQGQVYRAPYPQSGPNWQPNPQQGYVYRAPYPLQGLPAAPYTAVTSGVEREKLHPKPGARMPKAQALSLVQSLKKWVIVASIAAFGLFSALVAGNLHNTGSARQSTSSNQTTNPSTSSNSSNSNSGGFFGNQGGGSYGFGNGGSTQAPGTSTSVS